MRLLSWNVAGRQRSALEAQAERLVGAQADVVALQEITATTYEAWADRLLSAGYAVVSTVGLLSMPYPGPIKRRNCNLLATTGGIALLAGLTWPDPDQASVAFPEKHVAAQIDVHGLTVEVHNAHLPPGSTRGVIKPHAFEAIARRLDESAGSTQILCGDFNSPRSENDDGVRPWGWPARWRNAERSILEHPRLHDIYRAKHESGTEFAVSHRTRSGPKRYDHVYADPNEWASLSCRYRTDWLDAGLSDHAAVEAELTPK